MSRYDVDPSLLDATDIVEDLGFGGSQYINPGFKGLVTGHGKTVGGKPFSQLFRANLIVRMLMRDHTKYRRSENSYHSVPGLRDRVVELLPDIEVITGLLMLGDPKGS